MAATALTREELLKTIITELASGVDAAVEHWMARIDRELNGFHKSAEEKLKAVREILAEYRQISGKGQQDQWIV
jgi:triphosphoribosyl-dephospho-CoA synthetase